MNVEGKGTMAVSAKRQGGKRPLSFSRSAGRHGWRATATAQQFRSACRESLRYVSDRERFPPFRILDTASCSYSPGACSRDGRGIILSSG